ncbi:MAG: PD-(D/E)XK nuclease family protein [Acidobacteria bacterium]|nr:PD-(D/E)XK nuclease family protein [Acidobacteriota bacterium]
MPGDPLIDHLAELCRCHPTRSKWVIVPAHAIGLTLSERLAREGTSWVNLRIVTPLDLATRMAAPFLLEQGLEPSEEGLGGALVMRLLLALSGEGGYFRPMARHASMGDALWRTIRELRYAGVKATQLAARPFTAVAAKQAELVELLRAYESHLGSSGIADTPQVFEEAPRRPEWSPVAAGDLVVELAGVPWPPLVRRFLDALPGERSAAPLPGRWPSRATRDQTALFHAGGRDAEIDEIFRRIAESKAPLDQVEIACSAAVPASLAFEKAARLEWPVTISSGVPAAITRPGRLLLRFCDWLESGFDAAELRRLLQSGDCWSKGFGGDEADLSPGQAARLLLRAGAAWGRETYSLALTRQAEEYQRRASDPEGAEEERAWNARKARQTRVLLAWVEAVLERIPDPAASGGTVRLHDLAAAAIAFLKDNAARWGGLDALGLEAIVPWVDELAALGDYRCPLEEGTRFLRQRVGSLAVGRARPKAGHLHVSTLDESGYDGRPLVFVAGLEEGAVFPAAIEDPVLLDAERRAIGAGLPTSHERQARQLDRVLSRLDALAGSASRVCYSFSCRDTREFRETFPSWIVLGAFRLQQGDESLTYVRLRAHLGEPVSPVPRAPALARTDSGWWLASRRARGAEDAILRAFPSLARGREASAARESKRFTSFDGLVPEAAAALDPARTGRPVSATTLEETAKCPLRFFMRQGLGVRPIEEGKAAEDTWLDPRTKGTELHALYARITRTAAAEGRRPALEVDRPRLETWGRERLEALRREMPPPSDEVFARESRDFLDDLDAFIAAECEGRHGAEPVGFEVPFGFPLGEGEPETLASPAVVEFSIGDGRRFLLHGRIDRINRLKGHDYEVADYKGRYRRDDWQGAFAGGTRLQHALYGVAASALLKRIDVRARVVRGTYLFPSVRGFRARKIIPAPSREKLAAVLRDLSDLIGSGCFAPANGRQACQWCEYGAACHVADPEVVQAKVEDEKDAALAAYWRLRSHE